LFTLRVNVAYKQLKLIIPLWELPYENLLLQYFTEVILLCFRLRLSPTDVSNVVRVAEKFIDRICPLSSADLCCKGDDLGLGGYHKTAGELCVEDKTALVVQRNVEILTECLRLLRNACVNCLNHQSVLQTSVYFLYWILYTSSLCLRKNVFTVAHTRWKFHWVNLTTF